MTLWIVLIILCLLAILFSVWPLWKASHKLSPLVALVIVFTVALAAGMYDNIGSPNAPSGRSGPLQAGRQRGVPAAQNSPATEREPDHRSCL